MSEKSDVVDIVSLEGRRTMSFVPGKPIERFGLDDGTGADSGFPRPKSAGDTPSVSKLKP